MISRVAEKSVEQLGGGPPEYAKPVDLAQRLASIERPRIIVDFPRKGPDGKPLGTLAIVVLRQSEIMACMAAADGYARLMLKEQKGLESSLGYHDLYTDAKVVELLWRACKRNDDTAPNAPVWIDSQAMRGQLTSDEIAVLFNAYSDWQAESGPIVASMTEPEMDAWIDKLKEGLSRLPLAQLSSEARTDLLMHSVARLRTSATGSSSPGSPLDGSRSEVPPDAVADAT